MGIPAEAAAYLLRRGYSAAWLEAEEVHHVEAGTGRELAGVRFGAAFDSIAFVCRSPSGEVVGISLAAYGAGEKRYEWRPARPWLPICYASARDWELLHRTGEAFLVEGAFDRIAVKRAFPERAAVARLSKSVAPVEWVLRRYARAVWLAFDQDEEGEKAARRLERRLSGHLVVNRLGILGKDPGEHFERHGVDSLRSHFERQMEVAL